MSLISFGFLVLVGLALCVYYIVPMNYRWCILLIASLVFYVYSGRRAMIIAAIIVNFSYYMAIQIEKSTDGRKRKIVLSLSVVILLTVLALIKIGGRIDSLAGYLIMPMGISYFSLSIIGYLLDIYWKKDTAERNIGHYLTFVFYFPKIVQGPISRHSFLKSQIIAGKRFDYNQVCFGMQLALWGGFKKIVVADRINRLVSTVYSNLDIYASHGGILAIAMLGSAVQLYLDFSGYTDIARGISQMFGIELEENFNHPFFSRSASEFWQRWHMTLSGWFKDYLFLPVSRSQSVKKLSKQMGLRFGPAARKKTMMIISTAVVWIATGLWHGTGVNYIVWGIYWGGIIIFSELFDFLPQRINKWLKINTSAPTWELFRMIRTFMIFVLGKMISAQKSLYDVKMVLWGIFRNIHLNDISVIYDFGLSKIDFMIVLWGMLFVFMVSLMQEKGISVRESIARWNAVPRWMFYSTALSIVLLVGIYGAEYDTSSFAYQFF